MTAIYRTLNGRPCTDSAPERGIWYSAGCTFWTDDWSALRSFGPGIPCCPDCGAPGMQTDAKDWEGGAAKFEQQGNPGYVVFLTGYKGVCAGRRSSLMKLWKAET